MRDILLRAAVWPLLLFVSIPILAQRNEIAVSAIGDFNPASYIRLNDLGHGGESVVSSNKSSAGGSVEYRHWFGDFGLGALYEQNPSDGKLFVGATPSMNGAKETVFIWPLMRYEALILGAERFSMGKSEAFIQEGAGVLLSNGYGNSGWSPTPAYAYGFGIDYQIGKHLASRSGLLLSVARPGCYGDQTCSASWATSQDARTGLVFRW